MRVNSVIESRSDNCYRAKTLFGGSKPITFSGQAPTKLIKNVDSGTSIKIPNTFNSAFKFAKQKLNFLGRTSFMKLDFSSYEIPVNNPALAPYMNESYSYSSFKKLYRQAEADGVFKFKVDENTGFVKTSDIIAQTYEEKKMANLVWVTDTCRNMTLLKKERPELCTKALESLSSFYKKQQAEFDDVIANPEIFNSHDGWGKGGVAHQFNPQSWEPMVDFPKTRLESMGQYLQRASELIVGGLENGTASGYKNSKSISDNTIDGISNCVKYLSALKYPEARSCGAWEEHTFSHSLTSDTAIINEGFRRIMSLMYKKTDNPEILKVRERILASKYGGVFNDKNNLSNLIKQGEERIISNHYEEAPGQRKLDAALSFVTHYENSHLVHENPSLTRSQNVIADINENVKLLMALEGDANSPGLVGEYGMKRYLGDGYKNLNYDLPEKKGFINENHEAQWFIVSDISKGYGVQLKKLLKVLKEEKRLPNDDEKNIIGMLLAKETEFSNRTYARITGKNQTKANGQECPANKLTEAYQAVTDKFNKVKMAPGTNTPLAWAESSALDSSKIQMQNLKDLEQIGYKPSSKSWKRVV